VSITLHWFRSDLRLHDNLALSAAQAAGPVVALYIATPQQWRTHDDALVKQDYWRRNLHVLETELRERGVPLLYVEVPSYREQRDVPSVDGTSRLSPALAAGALSIRECWRRAPWQESEGALVWQNELLWRDFYKYVMWHYPHVCKKLAWRGDVGHVPWRHDDKEFRQWCDGRTGIPIIDAAMRQLQHSGWMHNRLRMLTAMFLTKHLLIDWRWGERWFMQHLIDGDFAANNGGWQWSASTGTDAAPYFRVFNPVTQSRRFDPDGTFIRKYVPELAGLDNAAIHDPGLLRPDDYPAPIIDLAFGRERALTAFRK
jgi:deoxyribodipyrimidine photo-lyase